MAPAIHKLKNNLGVESNLNTLEIDLIRFQNLWFDWFKKAKMFKKFDENWFKFNLFDSTLITSGSQMIRNWISSKFLRFDYSNS